MDRALLDTDILSEYLKGHDRAVARRATDYARVHGVFTFSSVTVHEIVFGLELKNATAQLQKALVWLNQNEQVIPTAQDYLDAAFIKASARTQGSACRLFPATRKTSKPYRKPASRCNFKTGGSDCP